MKKIREQRSTVTGRRGAKMMALAAMAAYTAMSGRTLAIAQQLVAESGKVPTPAQLPVRRFRIADGPLSPALDAYRTQSGVNVTLELTADELSSFKTKGVTGLLSSDAALRELLAGTGLSFQFSGADAVSVGVKLAESVDVTGSTLPDATTMSRFTESLIDTPQTVAVVPQFILKDEGNRSLTDAIRNVPGISIAAGESGAQGDNLTIRGFTARNDIFLDGIRDFGSYYRDSFDFDQVEVLEGPAGVQFGRGSTGGVINQESKVPTTDKFENAQAQLGTDATRRATMDVNHPFPDFANGSAVRLAAMGTEGGVAGRPFAENNRYGVAPSISFGMNGATRLTISYFHFTESDTPDYGLPWFFNQLSPGANRHSYYGFPNANFLDTNDNIVSVKANHSFSENVDVHTIGRWANYPRNVQITEPQICSNVSQVQPVGTVVAALPTNAVNTSLPCAYNFSTPSSQITVNRNQLAIKSVEGDLWDQTELTAKFKLLGIRNDFAGGVEGGREISNPIRTSFGVSVTTNGVKGTLNTVPSTNLVSPNPHDAFAGNGYISGITHLKSQSMGAYFVDTVKLGRMFEASGGVRWDLFDTVVNLYAPPTSVVGAVLTAAIPPTEQKVTQPTYRAAFVFKPNAHGSVYFDYGTSFNPSAESLSLSVSSSLLPPEENETFEVGAKYSLLKDKLKVEGAWFHTEKDNARETDPTNSNNIVLAGNQLVKGVQASAVGRLAGGMDVVVGYAFLSSDVLYSKLFPLSIGFPLANVPKQTFNAFVTHRLPLRLSAGFGGNYVASRTASSTVPYVPTAYAPNPNGAGYVVTAVGMKQVPGYWVFNAMVKRPISDHIELQANVYNLLNRFYIDQPHPSHLIPGAGLNAQVGANFRF